MTPPAHELVFLAVPPVMAHDLTVAQAVLGEAVAGAGAGTGAGTGAAGRPGYRVRVATPEPGPVETVIGPDLVIGEGLDLVARAETVFVIGGGARPDPDDRVLAALREAAARGKRVVGSCTGVFVLAHAGLLDGRRATTHWHLLDELARTFPRVRAEQELYVEDGPVLTSAGAAAVIELCLHLVRTDHGAAAAAAAGSLVVAAPARDAAQPQPRPPAPARPAASADRSTDATRAWAGARLHTPIAAADLAAHARVSARTLSRRFHAETGLSPLRWLLWQRVDLARQLLETTDLTMDRIAERAGLGSPDSLRKHFVADLGVTPSAYRARWRGAR